MTNFTISLSDSIDIINLMSLDEQVDLSEAIDLRDKIEEMIAHLVSVTDRKAFKAQRNRLDVIIANALFAKM